MRLDNPAEWVLRLILFAVAVSSLYLGFSWPLWAALLVGVVLALLGVFFLVLILDGDGSPW